GVPLPLHIRGAGLEGGELFLPVAREERLLLLPQEADELQHGLALLGPREERGQECDDAGGLSGPGAARIAARLRPRLEGGEERARVLEVEGQELESVEFLARERAGHARGRGVERRRV